MNDLALPTQNMLPAVAYFSCTSFGRKLKFKIHSYYPSAHAIPTICDFPLSASEIADYVVIKGGDTPYLVGKNRGDSLYRETDNEQTNAALLSDLMADVSAYQDIDTYIVTPKSASKIFPAGTILLMVGDICIGYVDHAAKRSYYRRYESRPDLRMLTKWVDAEDTKFK